MTGIDTNVFVRYIVRDDESQALKADKIFADCSENSPALINQIVLVEIIRVLKRLYKYSKSDLLKVLELIIFNRDIKVLDSEEAKNAFFNYKKGKADFSDYLIAQINKKHKALCTITFDKFAADDPDFKLLE